MKVAKCGMYQMRHERTLFCSSLVKSEPTTVRPKTNKQKNSSSKRKKNKKKKTFFWHKYKKNNQMKPSDVNVCILSLLLQTSQRHCIESRPSFMYRSMFQTIYGRCNGRQGVRWMSARLPQCLCTHCCLRPRVEALSC